MVAGSGASIAATDSRLRPVQRCAAANSGDGGGAWLRRTDGVLGAPAAEPDRLGGRTLNAQDGIADTTLDCGPGGGDVANRDRASIDLAPTNCETVNTIPEPPPDTDGDGAADSSDNCATQAGPASNGGCPLPSPPNNDISFGKAKLNTDKGNAKLLVAVPGGGELELSGKGVEPVAKEVSGQGTVNMSVKPTGKTADKLDDEGKAKVTVEVTFKPTGGEQNSESKKVRLKQTRRCCC